MLSFILVLTSTGWSGHNVASAATTWTTATSNTTQPIYKVAYGNGMWVGAAEGGKVVTSTDGSTWTERTVDTATTPYAQSFLNVTYGGGKWVVVGNEGHVFTSNDGINWTNNSINTANNLSAVVYANSTYVIGANSGNIYYSSDAVTWTNTKPASDDFLGVAYGNSIFVAVGANGIAYSSPDGTTWTNRGPIAGSSSVYSVRFLNGSFYATSDGKIVTSTNGTSWNAPQTISGASGTVLYDITYSTGKYVIVGDLDGNFTNGVILTSSNGTSWTTETPNSTPVLYGVTSTSNQFTAVGDSGAIRTQSIAAASTNANLSALSISSGTLSPTFASGTTSYTASVANATTSLTVTPTVADSTASVKVNGVTVTSGTASGAIALAVGSNTITTVVTAQDGTTTKTYTITVTRAGSSNADLSALSLSAGTLSPAFASGTTNYTASVGNATTSLTVTPTVADGTASVKVNGVTVTSGNASGAIPLNVGSNTITTVVTAQNNTTKTYTITVTRSASSNANLSGLSLSAGTLSPTFASGTTSYTASVSNATTSLTVTPTVADSTASVTVNGVAVSSGTASGAIALAVGSNTITTVVTAQDATTRTYTLTVTREAATNNANLANILISVGTLSPAFDTTITAYNASVTATTSSIDITPTTQDINATVKINGNNVSSGNTSSVNLAVGVNTVAIEVTAQDGSIKTYRIDIQRPQNANLSNLTISEGTLNPVFNTNTKSYTATVNYSSSTIQVTPTAISTPQAITVAGIEATSASPTTVALAVGSNTVPIVITMGDGSTQTYTITITRNNISDDDAVDEAYNALVIGYAAGDSASSVTQNLTLALTGTNGTIINWNSSNPSIIQNNGTVTRPSYPNPDTTITLNAVIQKNTALSIKTFTVVVKALPITDAQAVEADIQTLQVQYANGDNADSVTQNVGLAQAGSNNTVITWESSNPQRVSSTGTVTRSTYSEGDQTVRLTAQVTRGIVTDTKTFDLILKAKSASSGSNLKGLTVNGLVLSPAFNPEINNYNMSVNNSTSTVTVTASVYDPEATITVNGKTLADAGTSDPIALSVGDNVITIIVTAQNGATQTYTITIKRDKKSDSGSGGGGSGNNDDPSTPGTTPGTTEPTTPSTPATDGFEIIVNGRQIEQIATGVLEQQNGQSVFTATVDTDKLGNLLANEGNAPQVIIPVKASADKVNTVLTGEAVQILAGAQATLRIETVLGNYTLPSTQLRIQQLAGELGNNASSAQLQVNVTITRSTDAILTALNNRASRDGFTVAMAPVDFNITASYNNQVSTVNEFTTYVKRELPIPADYDPNRITTAVVVDAQGNIHHVPTAVAQQGNAYYAVVNSLTNSNYGLIWNPKEFPDVANHWSKSAVNDMASRLVVNGVDSTHFNPNSNVTRAEFAAILVRALGLSDTGTSSKFSDVSTSDWYMGAVTVANKYNLIDGYENGTFRPNQTISRQEAFVILNRAIAIVKLQQATGSTTTLSSYSDQRKVATWAQTATQAVLSSGVVQGNGKLLNPTGQMSRAETATVMQRLLKLAKLI
ncbi:MULTISPECIES: cadherin-like beta sandwich domain-containing protein [unclassified Paenibacillus]|uniref:cadherin-like beta sandwich domain-containing protein n=1 Tax=unclassified Paenibacillus TaxID=185978 RepID=UPI0027D88BAF|nr:MULTISPECIES: cadherin-like beta sandwich domain-containing protein [unclassified Paenibacillus]